jgi:hypothetical protein
LSLRREPTPRQTAAAPAAHRSFGKEQQQADPHTKQQDRTQGKPPRHQHPHAKQQQQRNGQQRKLPQGQAPQAFPIVVEGAKQRTFSHSARKPLRQPPRTKPFGKSAVFHRHPFRAGRKQPSAAGGGSDFFFNPTAPFGKNAAAEKIDHDPTSFFNISYRIIVSHSPIICNKKGDVKKSGTQKARKIGSKRLYNSCKKEEKVAILRLFLFINAFCVPSIFYIPQQGLFFKYTSWD